MAIPHAYCIAVLTASTLAPRQDLTIRTDEQNVVAARLAGEWVPDEEIGARLGTKPRTNITFEVDAGALDRVPARLTKGLSDRQLFLAGTVRTTSSEKPPKESVFVLVTSGGNPHLIYYRSRHGGEIDDAESSIVNLVPASDSKNDMLFMGGDFNNEPFRAWKRKSE